MQLLRLFAQPDGDLVQIVLQQAEAALAVVAHVERIIAGVDAAQVRREPRHLRRDRPLVAQDQQHEPAAEEPDQHQVDQQQARQQAPGSSGIWAGIWRLAPYRLPARAHAIFRQHLRAQADGAGLRRTQRLDDLRLGLRIALHHRADDARIGLVRSPGWYTPPARG